MPNPFDYTRDTRAQELEQFFKLKGIPLAPQLLNTILGSIGGNAPGFNSPYGSIGRGHYANRTSNLAEKLYVDPFSGGQSLQRQEQDFRDNAFATKYILPFYKTNLGVRDPKVQQALGAAKEIDQFAQMATGHSFINAMSGNFSNAAVAQNLAAASYANYYGSGTSAAKAADADLKFIRDQMYSRDARSLPGENGMRNLVPVVTDMRKTGGLEISDYTSVYNTLKQEGIIKGGLGEGKNAKKVAGFGEAITAARNVFGESTGTGELLQMFEEMHGDLANVDPEQIKSTMTKLTAILDVTQKGAQELIAKTENIRMTASQYGGHIDMERALEITTGSIFRETELKDRGFSGKQAEQRAGTEALAASRAAVSSGGIMMNVLSSLGVDQATLEKIGANPAEMYKLSPELQANAHRITNDLYGNAEAQKRFLDNMTQEQKRAATVGTGAGVQRNAAAILGNALGIDTSTALAFAKHLDKSDIFKKNLKGEEARRQMDKDIESFIESNPQAAILRSQSGYIMHGVATGGATTLGESMITAAYSGDPSLGSVGFRKSVAEGEIRAKEQLDAQAGNFYKKDKDGNFVLDAAGKKIVDKSMTDKVIATKGYLIGQGMNSEQAGKLAIERSDSTVRGVAAVLKVAQQSGDPAKLADAKKWAALKLGERWGSTIADDKVMDVLSYTMEDVKDPTNQAPQDMIRGGKDINVELMKSETEGMEKKAKEAKDAKMEMKIPTKVYFGDNGVIEAIARMVFDSKQTGR